MSLRAPVYTSLVLKGLPCLEKKLTLRLSPTKWVSFHIPSVRSLWYEYNMAAILNVEYKILFLENEEDTFALFIF